MLGEPTAKQPWVQIFGKSARADLWVDMEWEGKADLGPYLTDDGEDIYDVIAAGRAEELPFRVWAVRDENSRGKCHGDILWGIVPLVSNRFAQALSDLGVEGFGLYDIDFYDRDGTPIEGYTGFTVDITGHSEFTSLHWHQGLRNEWFLTTQQVLDGLYERGIDGFETGRVPRKWIPPWKPGGTPPLQQTD